jgi:hypothetical protein
LYPALDRLRADELIEVDREEIVDSRLRRYYRLTALGKKRLAIEAARLQANADAADVPPEASRRGGEMTDSARLERRYRRLLAWYPRAFRREHEQEILCVLMEGAEDGHWRPGLAESANLLRSALWMRLRPGAPRSARTVSAAVRLMYVRAVVELCTLATVVVTLGDLKSAIVQRDPHYTAAQWHADVNAHVVPLEIGAVIATGVWLCLAWANGRGHRWARVVFAVFFAITTLSLLNGVAEGAATYASADLIAGVVLWLVALATLALVFHKQSGPHYRRS